MSEEIAKEGLDLMRVAFPPNQISKLPKPTKKQTEDVKADYKKGIRCGICGTWHHPEVVHLDYVGHAALTDRLLDCDPFWTWEPLAVSADGYPVIDKDGGMWIKLTVCGVTRLGYGDAQGKTGGDAMKERIGDALRNAAMRFGAALDLWHKGELHVADDDEPPAPKKPQQAPQQPAQSAPATQQGQSADSKKKPATAEQLRKIEGICTDLSNALQLDSASILRDLSEFEGKNGPVWLTWENIEKQCTFGWAGKVISEGEKRLK